MSQTTPLALKTLGLVNLIKAKLYMNIHYQTLTNQMQ